MRIYVLAYEEAGSGATWLARRMARRRNGSFRAPHHTVSDVGAQGELAIAAGGTLFLDEALEFRPRTVRQLLSTWRMMPEPVRPDLVLGCRVPEDDAGARRRMDELLESLPVIPCCLRLRRPDPRKLKPEVTPW